MKVIDYCVCCDSRNVTRRASTMAAYVVKRIFGWMPAVATINGANIVFPSRTDSIYCQDCGFLSCDWRFDDEEMAKLYDDYRGPSYVHDRNSCEPGYANINDALGKSPDELRTRLHNLQDMLQQYIDCEDIASVLDYGGDEGQFIPSCLGSANKFVYDISGKDTLRDIQKISKEDQLDHYDLTMCCQVLEHCSYPREVARKIKNLTKRYAYIEVPMDREHLPDKNYLNAYSEHINLFNETSLRTLLELEGFHILDIRVCKILTVLGPGLNLMALCSVNEEAAQAKPAPLLVNG